MINVTVRRNGVNCASLFVDADSSIADLRQQAITKLKQKGLVKEDRDYGIKLGCGRYPDPDMLVKYYKPAGESYQSLIVEVIEC